MLDVCCGPGWLALELARHGQTVDAYDISPQAIALAKRMLSENPYRDGFGEVNYYLQDVTKVDLGCERYDAVSGWAAFHHIPDLSDFMERVWRALKPGGIIATMDDMPQGFIRQVYISEPFCHFAQLLHVFSRKIKKIIGVLSGTASISPEVFSPMEQGKSIPFMISRTFFGEKNMSYWKHKLQQFCGTNDVCPRTGYSPLSVARALVWQIGRCAD